MLLSTQLSQFLVLAGALASELDVADRMHSWIALIVRLVLAGLRALRVISSLQRLCWHRKAVQEAEEQRNHASTIAEIA